MESHGISGADLVDKGLFCQLAHFCIVYLRTVCVLAYLTSEYSRDIIYLTINIK